MLYEEITLPTGDSRERRLESLRTTQRMAEYDLRRAEQRIAELLEPEISARINRERKAAHLAAA
jgi:capsule polysaccharide export protein KpsC/LpsZ